MAVGKASLKRAAKAAETEVEDGRSLQFPKRKHRKRQEPLQRPLQRPKQPQSQRESQAEPSEVKPKKSSVSRKTKAAAETAAAAEKPADNTVKKTDSSQNSRNLKQQK